MKKKKLPLLLKVNPNTLKKEAKTETQETTEFKLNETTGTYLCDTPLISKEGGQWMLGLNISEVYDSVFLKLKKKNEFKKEVSEKKNLSNGLN